MCANPHAANRLTGAAAFLQSNPYGTEDHRPRAPGCHPVESRRASVPRLEAPLTAFETALSVRPAAFRRAFTRAETEMKNVQPRPRRNIHFDDSDSPLDVIDALA